MADIDYALLAQAVLKAQREATRANEVNSDGRLVAATVGGGEKRVGVGERGGVEQADGGSARGAVGAVGLDWSEEVTQAEKLKTASLVMSGGVSGKAVSSSGSDDGSEASSMSGGVPPAVGSSVRGRVFFGGIAVGDGGEKVELPSDASFFKTVVRGAHAKALFAHLVKLGIRLPRHARGEMALCAYTAGTMPQVATEGKRRLKGLAAVGDASLTLHLFNDSYHKGNSVEEAQALRSKYTSDKHLCDVLARTKLASCVSFAPGVDAATSKAASTALEAIIGVLTIHLPPEVVKRFLHANKVYAV